MGYKVYFDGSYGGRHKSCAYGFLIYNEDGEVVIKEAGHVGSGYGMSDLVGEYSGLYAAMEYVATRYPTENITFFGDCLLVIRQMSGSSRALKGSYLPYYARCKALAKNRPWRFRWIPRSFNTEADELSQYFRFKQRRTMQSDTKAPESEGIKQLKGLSTGLKNTRDAYRRLLTDPEINKPFTDLENAVEKRLKEDK